MKHPLFAWSTVVSGLLLVVQMLGCSPTIKLDAPSEPIVINLNVKIEHEIRVRLEKGVEDLISHDRDLF